MERFFLTIVQMGMTASVVIPAVLVLRALLKKAPKIFSYALWLVVFFRLVCPIAMEGAIGIPQKVMEQNLFSIVSGAEENTAVSEVSDTAQTTSQPEENEAGKEKLQASEQLDSVQEEAVGYEDSKADQRNGRLLKFGCIIWVAGMTILLCYNVFSFVLLKKKLKSAVFIEDNVYEMSGLPTPFVLGFIRPVIFLPTGIRGEERNYILAHERMHIKRCDPLINLMGLLVLILHWMNPLVWISFICMTRDMEMSCDEAVIRGFGSEIKKEYSSSLLHLAAQRSSLYMAPLAFGDGNVKGRIKNVLNYRKAGIGLAIVCFCILIGAAVFLSTNQKEPGNRIKMTRASETQPNRTSISQEHRLNSDVKSYMVFAVSIQDGNVSERNLIASGKITEENRKGELDIALEYMNQEDHRVTMSVTDQAQSQFMTIFLPEYTMRAGNMLWENEEQYHPIEINRAYLLETEYIGSEKTRGIEAFNCDDLMEDSAIWNSAMKQSENSGISMLMIYYVISDQEAEELTGKLDSFSLQTESIELSEAEEYPVQLKQMYQWRTQYTGDASAIGNITDSWFVNTEVPLVKNGFEQEKLEAMSDSETAEAYGYGENEIDSIHWKKN